MNYKMIKYILGSLLKIESILLAIPLLVSIIYQENNLLYFLIPIILCLTIGWLMTIKKPINHSIYTKESFLITALAWIVFSFFSTLPFYLSKEIPNFTNAFFETVSGLSTAGSTILMDVESLSNSMLFLRSFNQWIGGMGILVFALMIIPQTDAKSLQLMKAEVPGPIVGKLVSRIKRTARILYLIYTIMSVIMMMLLYMAGMPIFDSIVNTFAIAGTGGFAIKNASLAYYNSAYIEMLVAVFILLFGMNFHLFYLVITKKTLKAFKSEELKYYLLIIIGAVILIMFNTANIFTNIFESFRYVFFTVTSIITTTGFVTIDYNNWPVFSQTVIFFLMFIGGCAGSTAGGLKISRFIILLKLGVSNIKKVLHPHGISSLKFENKKVDINTLSAIASYFILYIVIMAISLLLISLDQFDFKSNLSAVVSSLNNIGPGLNKFGPIEHYAELTDLSKWVLIFNMLLGRLEIIPILLIFLPSTWRKH